MDNKLLVRESKDLLALLRDEQKKAGYISEQFIEGIAQSMALSIGEVYGVATFYHFLSNRPLGRNVIQVCKSIPCYLKSSQLIVDTIQIELGIRPGQTTADGRFSLQLTNCIGACDQVPVMLLNNDLHGNLTPTKVLQILKECP